MPAAMAASRLTKTFFSKATITGFIKFASKEAIPLAILFAFRERPLAVAGGLWARHVSWDKPSDGVAVCCGARAAGAKTRSGVPRAAADCAGARAIHWHHHRRGSRGACEPAASRRKDYCRCDFVWFRLLSSRADTSPELGRNASRLRR